MATAEPRSICRNFVAAEEQNLSLLPPDTLPLTAFAGPSLLLQGAEPVAGRFNARLPPGGGPAVGWDGGGSVPGLRPPTLAGGGARGDARGAPAARWAKGSHAPLL